MLLPSQTYFSMGTSFPLWARLGGAFATTVTTPPASFPSSTGSSSLAPGSILSGGCICFRCPSSELHPIGAKAQELPHTDETWGTSLPASGPLCTGCHNPYQAEELSPSSSFPATIWRFCRQRSRTTSLYLSLLLPPWYSLQTAPGGWPWGRVGQRETRENSRTGKQRSSRWAEQEWVAEFLSGLELVSEGWTQTTWGPALICLLLTWEFTISL